VEKHFIHFKY